MISLSVTTLAIIKADFVVPLKLLTKEKYNLILFLYFSRNDDSPLSVVFQRREIEQYLPVINLLLKVHLFISYFVKANQFTHNICLAFLLFHWILTNII